MKTRSPRTTVVLGLALALALGGPGPDPSPAAAQEENPEATAGRGKVKVLEPLPEEPEPAAAGRTAPSPGGELLEGAVFDHRLVDPAAPPEARPPAAASPLGTVRRWAEAWSSQDVERYLSFYARGFTPPAGQPRDEWEAERRSKVSTPGFIEVEVSFDDETASVPPGTGSVAVSFRQTYASDLYSDVVRKTLELVWEDGGWKIVAETSGDAARE